MPGAVVLLGLVVVILIVLLASRGGGSHGDNNPPTDPGAAEPVSIESARVVIVSKGVPPRWQVTLGSRTYVVAAVIRERVQEICDLQWPHPRFVEEWFRRMDADADGFITTREALQGERLRTAVLRESLPLDRVEDRVAPAEPRPAVPRMLPDDPAPRRAPEALERESRPPPDARGVAFAVLRREANRWVVDVQYEDGRTATRRYDDHATAVRELRRLQPVDGR